jgi:hypothetical protein
VGRFVAGLLAAWLVTLSVPHPGQAAPGDLDRSFGRRGKVRTTFGRGASALVLQPDGKLVAGGFDILVTVCDPFGYFGCRSFRWAFALARYQGN